MQHISAAKEFDIPDADVITAPYLVTAAQYVAQHASRPDLLHADRHRKMAVPQQVKKKLAYVDAAQRSTFNRLPNPSVLAIPFLF